MTPGAADRVLSAPVLLLCSRERMREEDDEEKDELERGFASHVSPSQQQEQQQQQRRPVSPPGMDEWT